MKKLLALILAAVLAIGMVACTTTPATDEPGTAPEADGSEEVDLSGTAGGLHHAARADVPRPVDRQL